MDKHKLYKQMRRYFLMIIWTIIAVAYLMPLILLLNVTTKTQVQFVSEPFYYVTGSLANFFENIDGMFLNSDILQGFLNSLFYAFTGTSICIICGTMVGYGVTKLTSKLSMPIFIAIFAASIFPFQMYIIPLFVQSLNWNLYDSKLVLVLIYGAICTPFAALVYRGFYLSLGYSMHEAALIDGCGVLRMYWKIYLPNLKAPTATIVLFQSMFIYNDMMFGMIFARSKETKPVMVILNSLAAKGIQGINIPRILGAAAIASIPTLLLFFSLRKYFINGFAHTVAQAQAWHKEVKS